jgi:Tol biopolymer transport system component
MEQSLTLAAATRLGPYEVLGPVGSGGMGEVYRAKDTRLDREVALKILPAGLAGNESFRARFDREAKAISSLNHPHICTLHDVGRQTLDGREVHYLVLELIEGESLADRIAKGALPMDLVLDYGIQIAGALDAAHRHAIVHRDLKPGNVMLTKSGAKLLDFGLAKASDTSSVAEVSTLPTRENKPLTEQGTIVGTFQYMAPEQLEGQNADARTDIFALGAVLHEMATGQKAFAGKSRTSLIAAIVSSHPPAISSVQPMCPPALDHVVRKCLEKDPDDRWQNAKDVMSELQWIAEGGSKVGLPAPIAIRRKTRERIAWISAALAAVAVIALSIGYVRRAPKPAPVVKFLIPTAEGLTAVGSPRISPDGRLVAFDGTDSAGKAQLYLRSLDALEVRALPGTDGASRPFWSPDGRFLGFIAGGKLRKVDVSGGPPQTICDAATGSDGTWSTNGTILFDGRANDPINRVSAAGGVAKAEVSLDPAKGRAGVGWPEFLPDGRHFLYVGVGQRSEESKLFVGTLDSHEDKAILTTGSRVQYVPPGYLLYVREQSLVAQAFDLKSLEVKGEPIPVAEGLGTNAVGLAHFSASQNGILTYRAGETRDRLLTWVDRSGKELSSIGDKNAYGDLWPSPDWKRLAMDMPEGRSAKTDIWIRDLARGATSRFTFDPANDDSPVWSPDGRSIVFASDRKGTPDLYQKDASGAGEEQVLLATKEEKFPTDWSRDGKYLIFNSRGDETGWDVWAMLMTGERKPFPVVKTKFVELCPALSPDGRFVAYYSNESGRMEVYVQEFPEPKSKWQVSTGGGNEPQWRADGREMFYIAPDQRLMAVPIEAGASFTTGTPQPLFQARLQLVTARSHYRPSSDGQRFLTLAPVGRDAILPTTVILNWPASLRN